MESEIGLPAQYNVDISTSAGQYVVVAAGGHPFIYQKPGDYLVAFALPED